MILILHWLQVLLLDSLPKTIHRNGSPVNRWPLNGYLAVGSRMYKYRHKLFNLCQVLFHRVHDDLGILEVFLGQYRQHVYQRFAVDVQVGQTGQVFFLDLLRPALGICRRLVHHCAGGALGLHRVTTDGTDARLNSDGIEPPSESGLGVLPFPAYSLPPPYSQPLSPDAAHQALDERPLLPAVLATTVNGKRRHIVTIATDITATLLWRGGRGTKLNITTLRKRTVCFNRTEST